MSTREEKFPVMLGSPSLARANGQPNRRLLAKMGDLQKGEDASSYRRGSLALRLATVTQLRIERFLALNKREPPLK